jgi:hypothetical protein
LISGANLPCFEQVLLQVLSVNIHDVLLDLVEASCKENMLVLACCSLMIKHEEFVLNVKSLAEVTQASFQTWFIPENPSA